MLELKEVVYKIIDRVHDAGIEDSEWGAEGDHFSYSTNQYDEIAEWRGTQIYHVDDDRGWDDEKDDYERSIEGQIIHNLTGLRDKLNDILSAIG